MSPKFRRTLCMALCLCLFCGFSVATRLIAAEGSETLIIDGNDYELVRLDFKDVPSFINYNGVTLTGFVLSNTFTGNGGWPGGRTRPLNDGTTKIVSIAMLDPEAILYSIRVYDGESGGGVNADLILSSDNPSNPVKLAVLPGGNASLDNMVIETGWTAPSGVTTITSEFLTVTHSYGDMRRMYLIEIVYAVPAGTATPTPTPTPDPTPTPAPPPEPGNANPGVPIYGPTINLDFSHLTVGSVLTGTYMGVGWGAGDPGWKVCAAPVFWGKGDYGDHKAVAIDSASDSVEKIISIPTGGRIKELTVANTTGGTAVVTLADAANGQYASLTLASGAEGVIYTGWAYASETVSVGVEAAGGVSGVLFGKLTFGVDEDIVLDFADATSSLVVLSGMRYGIDWGAAGNRTLASPTFELDNGKALGANWEGKGHFRFNAGGWSGSGVSSKTITLPAGMVLKSIRTWLIDENPLAQGDNLTLTSAGNTPLVIPAVRAGGAFAPPSYETGWTEASPSVTFTVTGRTTPTYIFELVYGPALKADFLVQFAESDVPPENLIYDPVSNENYLIGTYAGVDWGSDIGADRVNPGWALETAVPNIAWGASARAIVPMAGWSPPAQTVSKKIVIPAGTVLKSFYVVTEGNRSGSITLESPGNPTVTRTFANSNRTNNTNPGSKIETGWFTASTDVTIHIYVNDVSVAGGCEAVQLGQFLIGSPYFVAPEPPAPLPPWVDPGAGTRNNIVSPVPDIYTVVDEGMSFQYHSGSGGGTYQTPVVTGPDGSIYSVWIEGSGTNNNPATSALNIAIARKDGATGEVTKEVVMYYADADSAHCSPSVAIDADGFIHVIGSMHGSGMSYVSPQNAYNKGGGPWMYFVSKSPDSIEDGFEYVGSKKAQPGNINGDNPRGIPGKGITYGRFFTAIDGTVFVAFRQELPNIPGGGRNEIMSGLARYDADSRSWTALGGTDYPGHPQQAAASQTVSMFWSEKMSGNSYDQGQMEIYFEDRGGGKERLHIIAMLQDWGTSSNNGYAGSQIAYAYSDDYGETFFRADGSQYTSLPVRRTDAGPAGTVVGRPWTAAYDLATWGPGGSNGTTLPNGYLMYSEGLSVGQGANGITVTFTRSSVASYESHWDGARWTEPRWIPIQRSYNGVTSYWNGKNYENTGFRQGGGLSRTHTGWNDWNNYTDGIPGSGQLKFDLTHARNTGEIRYQTSVGGMIYVYTVKFEPAASAVFLESLTPSTGTLSPAFTPATTEYTLTLPYQRDKVTFVATVPDGSGYTVTGDAGVELPLSVGDNPFAITVASSTGSRTYNIVVILEEYVPVEDIDIDMRGYFGAGQTWGSSPAQWTLIESVNPMTGAEVPGNVSWNIPHTGTQTTGMNNASGAGRHGVSYRNNQSARSPIVYSGGFDWVNYSVESTMRIVENQRASGLVFRGNISGDYYAAYFTLRSDVPNVQNTKANSFGIAKVVDGNWTVLGDVTLADATASFGLVNSAGTTSGGPAKIAASEPYAPYVASALAASANGDGFLMDFKVDVLGDTFKFYVNGTLLLTVTDGDIIKGSVGFFTDRAVACFYDLNVFNDASAHKDEVLGVTVTPETASVERGRTLKFSAYVDATGDADRSVAWSVDSAYSHITDGGLLTVDRDEPADALTVTATSVFDNTKSASAAVAVTDPPPPTPREEYEVTVYDDMFFESNAANASQYTTPIAHYNGSVYTVWHDAARRLMIAKMDADGIVETFMISSAPAANDSAHVTPSIGIDADGYIHVAHDMHHHDWKYFVSNEPEDITTITSKAGTPQQPPGSGITYPRFYTDREGTLYLTYRQMLGTSYNNCPKGTGVAKYDVNTKTWKAIGGVDYPEQAPTWAINLNSWDKSRVSLFYSNRQYNGNGSGDGVYDGAIAEMYFDKDNGMHIIAIMQDSGSSNDGYDGSHIAYAFSPDGGETFYRADGSKYETLPVTPERAGAGGLIVGRPFSIPDEEISIPTPRRIPKGLYTESIGITVDGEGTLIATFVLHGNNDNSALNVGGVPTVKPPGTLGSTTSFITRFPVGATEWDEPVWLDDLVVFHPYILAMSTDDAGNTIILSGTGAGEVFVHRSSDGGRTWQRYGTGIIGTTFRMFDRAYYASTGIVLFQYMHGNNAIVPVEKQFWVGVASVKFAPPEPFVPVTDIKDVPNAAETGVALELAGRIIPANATARGIVWTVADAGATGTVIEGGTFTATNAGTARVLATIADGVSEGEAFTKTFTITVGLKPIKSVYTNDFLIGNIMGGTPWTGDRLTLFTHHYNVATAENLMKPSRMQPNRGSFSWTAADRLVDQAVENGMKFHGHVLYWSADLPGWMQWAAIENQSKEESLTDLRNHVTTVVKHYDDKYNSYDADGDPLEMNFISWDVVNEAMENMPYTFNGLKTGELWHGDYKPWGPVYADDDWRCALNSRIPYFRTIGPDFIEEAFLAARLAAPHIMLYYNDYYLENPQKAKAVYDMVRDINTRYLESHGFTLIDGVGFQGHYTLYADLNELRNSLDMFAGLIDEGLLKQLSFSELDIEGGANNILTPAEARVQGRMYAELFTIFKEYSDYIARVTWWGLSDGNSWMADTSPTLFDRTLQPKPAYHAVIGPEQYLFDNAGLVRGVLTVWPAGKVFPKIVTGYDETITQEFTVTNNSGATFGGLTASMENGAAFVISGVSAGSLPPGASVTATIELKEGLPPGKYYDAVILSGSNNLNERIELFIEILEEEPTPAAGIDYYEDFNRNGFAIRDEWVDVYNRHTLGGPSMKSYLDLWTFNGSWAGDDYPNRLGFPHDQWDESAPNFTAIAYGGGMEWADYTMEISMNTIRGFDFEKGVVFRATENNFYSVYIIKNIPFNLCEGRIYLDKTVDGVTVNLAAIDLYGSGIIHEQAFTTPVPGFPIYRIDETVWNAIRVELAGGDIKVYINDKLAFDYFDEDPLTAGSVGVLSNNSKIWFKDLRVTYTPPVIPEFDGDFLYAEPLTEIGEDGLIFKIIGANPEELETLAIDGFEFVMEDGALTCGEYGGVAGAIGEDFTITLYKAFLVWLGNGTHTLEATVRGYDLTTEFTLDLPVYAVTITGVRAGFVYGLADETPEWVSFYAEATDNGDIIFIVPDGAASYRLGINAQSVNQGLAYEDLIITGLTAGETYDVSEHFYDVTVPEGFGKVGVVTKHETWAVYEAAAGDAFTLLKNYQAARLVIFAGEERQRVFDIILDGSDPFRAVVFEKTLVNVSDARFVSMIETYKNSRVWELTFSVTLSYSDGSAAQAVYRVSLNGNNANQDGRYAFDADHALAGYTLIYDIKGNGSNIKDFRIVR